MRPGRHCFPPSWCCHFQPNTLVPCVPWVALENLGCFRKNPALPSCTPWGRCGRISGRHHGNVNWPAVPLLLAPFFPTLPVWNGRSALELLNQRIPSAWISFYFFLLSFSLSSISNNWLSCPHESALLEALLAHPHVPINSPLDPKYQAEGSSLSEPGFSLSPSATCTSTQFPSPSATAQIQVSSPLSTCSHLLMGFLPLRPSPIRVHSPQLLTKWLCKTRPTSVTTMLKQFLWLPIAQKYKIHSHQTYT